MFYESHLRRQKDAQRAQILERAKAQYAAERDETKVMHIARWFAKERDWLTFVPNVDAFFMRRIEAEMLCEAGFINPSASDSISQMFDSHAARYSNLFGDSFRQAERCAQIQMEREVPS